MHNRLENDSGAWVALCAHPTHTDTDRSRLVRILFYPELSRSYFSEIYKIILILSGVPYF
jgi:hypothetical protein